MLSAGQAVYYEDSQAVWSIWESGFVRFSHQIKTPTISVDWLQNTSGGSPQLKTADGRGIVFQFVDDYANYVRFFRNDGFTNYLMQSPNMRYMDARDWGGTWAMLVQQNDGGNQIFFPAAYSDERLKTNVQPTQVDALAAIAAVEVVEYDWTEEGLTHARRAPDRQRVKIGVVAQRVQQQIPEMVLHQPEQAATETMGATPATWNIKPDEAVPYLIRAIQQQQELIVALTVRLAAVEAATGAGGRNA